MKLPKIFPLFLPTIETENLKNAYGGKSVVKNLSFSVEQGDIFTLLGANGSGKSTIVKMLTGLLEPTRSNTRILGQSILAESVELKKQIVVLPESLALFETFSVWEHILLTGKVYGLEKLQIFFAPKLPKLFENRSAIALKLSFSERLKSITYSKAEMSADRI